MTDVFDLAKFLSPFALGVVVWYAKVNKAIERAENAPSKSEVHEEVRKAKDEVLGEIQPMKEDLREIKTDLKWLVKERK